LPVRVEVAELTLNVNKPALTLASISQSLSMEVGVCRGLAAECSMKLDVDCVGLLLKATGIVFNRDAEKDADFGLWRAARRVL